VFGIIFGHVREPRFPQLYHHARILWNLRLMIFLNQFRITKEKLTNHKLMYNPPLLPCPKGAQSGVFFLGYNHFSPGAKIKSCPRGAALCAALVHGGGRGLSRNLVTLSSI